MRVIEDVSPCLRLCVHSTEQPCSSHVIKLFEPLEAKGSKSNPTSSSFTLMGQCIVDDWNDWSSCFASVMANHTKKTISGCDRKGRYVCMYVCVYVCHLRLFHAT